MLFVSILHLFCLLFSHEEMSQQETWFLEHSCCKGITTPNPSDSRAPAVVPIPQITSLSIPTPASSLIQSSSSAHSAPPESLTPRPQQGTQLTALQALRSDQAGHGGVIESLLMQAEREAIAFGIKEAMRKCPPAIVTFSRALNATCSLLRLDFLSWYLVLPILLCRCFFNLTH